MPKDLATGIFYILPLDIFCVLRRVLGKTCFSLLPETLKIPVDNNKSRSKGKQSSLHLPIGPLFTCFLYLPTKKLSKKIYRFPAMTAKNICWCDQQIYFPQIKCIQ